MTPRFTEQFRRVYQLKSPDVEEWIDVVWHRPLAAVVALVLVPTPIGPNLVTLGSLISGLAGAAALFHGIQTGETQWRWIAGLLVFASVILDCADGQLARAKGGGTRWGRILDGLVDFIVVQVLYVVIWYATFLKHGWGWAAIAFFAGYSSAIRIWVYDKFKAIYLSFVKPSESDGGESLDVAEEKWAEIRRSGSLPEKIGMFIYVGILLRLQEAIVAAPRFVPDLSEEEKASFREQHIGSVRLFTMLGLGTHMAFIYAAVFLSAWFEHAFEALHIVLLVPYNLLFIYAMWRNAPMRKGVGTHHYES